MELHWESYLKGIDLGQSSQIREIKKELPEEGSMWGFKEQRLSLSEKIYIYILMLRYVPEQKTHFLFWGSLISICLVNIRKNKKEFYCHSKRIKRPWSLQGCFVVVYCNIHWPAAGVLDNKPARDNGGKRTEKRDKQNKPMGEEEEF